MAQQHAYGLEHPCVLNLEYKVFLHAHVLQWSLGDAQELHEVHV